MRRGGVEATRPCRRTPAAARRPRRACPAGGCRCRTAPCRCVMSKPSTSGEVALADVAELGRVLQLQLSPRRHRQRRRRGRERAVAELAAATACARPRGSAALTSVDRHAPRLAAAGSSICRAAAPHRAHRLEEVAQCCASRRCPGCRSSPRRPAPARRLHARPVGLELVGDDHRHAGAHALAHLGAVADDGDGAVRRDGDEDLRIVAPAVRHAVGAVLLGSAAPRPRRARAAHASTKAAGGDDALQEAGGG